MSKQHTRLLKLSLCRNKNPKASWIFQERPLTASAVIYGVLHRKYSNTIDFKQHWQKNKKNKPNLENQCSHLRAVWFLEEMIPWDEKFGVLLTWNRLRGPEGKVHISRGLTKLWGEAEAASMGNQRRAGVSSKGTTQNWRNASSCRSQSKRTQKGCCQSCHQMEAKKYHLYSKGERGGA